MNLVGNKKLVIGLICVIASVWIGNAVYYYSNKLNEYIFLENLQDVQVIYYPNDEKNMELGAYYEDGTEEDVASKTRFYEFSLVYLTNIYDDEQVINVRFPEISDEVIWGNSESANNRFNNYTLRQIDVDFNNISMDEKIRLIDKIKNKDIVATKMIYETNKGKSYEVELGKIHFSYKDMGVDQDTASKMAYGDQQDLTILSIDSYFSDEVNALIEFYNTKNGIEECGIYVPYKTHDKYLHSILSREKSPGKLNGISINTPVVFTGKYINADKFKRTIYLDYNSNSFIGIERDKVKVIKEKGNKSYEYGAK